MRRYSPTIRVRALIRIEDSILICRLFNREIAFLPGGRVEAGEDLLSAIQREILEEAGVRPTKLAYLGAIEHTWAEAGMPVHDLNHYFCADCAGLSPKVIPKCKDEGVELFWTPISELQATHLAPSVLKTMIASYLAGDKLPWWATIFEA
jgi:8-oxo-dGTP pyrophosphatase MutT (NUDIX family)